MFGMYVSEAAAQTYAGLRNYTAEDDESFVALACDDSDRWYVARYKVDAETGRQEYRGQVYVPDESRW